jgi:hypothetical protein
MGYSHSNVIGLIEIDTGLAAHLAGESDDATLGQSLARLLPERADRDVATNPSAAARLRSTSERYKTEFLRADVDTLRMELDLAFHELLCELFEGE